jgi:hypothetical protein
MEGTSYRHKGLQGAFDIAATKQELTELLHSSELDSVCPPVLQSVLCCRPAVGSPSDCASTWEVIQTALTAERIVFAAPCTWAEQLLCSVLESSGLRHRAVRQVDASEVTASVSARFNPFAAQFESPEFL